MDVEELGRRHAVGEHRRGQVHRVADEVAHLERDLARLDIGQPQRRGRGVLEIVAHVACVALERDQLDLGVRVAEHVAAFLGHGDRGQPARRGAHRQQREAHQRQRAKHNRHAFPSSLSPPEPPSPRASDSSTVRSSGSPISRRLSPSSIGIGLSDGGAARAGIGRRLNLALPQFDPRDRIVAEEAVHPLDDLGDHVLDHRRMARRDDQLEDALALLAGREADRFRARRLAHGPARRSRASG